MKVVTAAQMRSLDAWTIDVLKIPGLVLMENAGQAMARALLSKWSGPVGRAVVVAGRGNNGGDGAVIARRLWNEGWTVSVLLCATRDQVVGDACANFALLDRLGVPVIEVADSAALQAHVDGLVSAEIIVDALLGTGAKDSLRGVVLAAVRIINQSRGFRLSVDLPTGVCADTGRILGEAVKAHLTVTCAFLKHGLLQYPGAEFAGEVQIAHIGIPPNAVCDPPVIDSVFHAIEAQKWVPVRRPASHKGTHGHVLVIGGSPGKAGAALLVATGALRAGAGLVTVGTLPSVRASLEGRLPEVMVEALDATFPEEDNTEQDDGGDYRHAEAQSLSRLMQGKSVIAIGSGLGTSLAIHGLVRTLLRTCRLPIILDADALNVLNAEVGICAHASVPVVLLPHPGEAARLLGVETAEIQENRPLFARQLAQTSNAYVVLKGARTIIAAPTGELRVVIVGNPVLATGGSGDVLAGVVATMVAQLGMSLESLALAVYLHGSAADRVSRGKTSTGILASEMAAQLPHILSALQPDIARLGQSITEIL